MRLRQLVRSSIVEGCLVLGFLLSPSALQCQDAAEENWMSFSQGVVPVALGGMAEALKVSDALALAAIDGNPGVYSLTPKPGDAKTELSIVYKLPALTTFREFAIPNVLETPSPSQTFFQNVKIEGATKSSSGPFEPLASATLKTHSRRDIETKLPVPQARPVRYVRLTLRGGIDVQRENTFFEFSEIVGRGTQEPVPLLTTFTGKWRGRGVLLELKQDGVTVSGCYDRDGDLTGTVTGNLLRATGKSRRTGVPSSFVITVTPSGAISGVRSTNGAPFHMQSGEADPAASTDCGEASARKLGCGSQVHGILFGFDSAEILPASKEILDALFTGLQDAPASKIQIVGHTSSEGSNDYNQSLSERRAASVVAALTERGIPAARLSARGAGESQFIAENKTEAGRSLNRRVEIVCQ